MKKLQNGAAFVFIFCIIILSGISICGIWQIFNDDVIGKSLETVGLLAVVSIIVMTAGKFIDARQTLVVSPDGVAHELPPEPPFHPAFTSIRHGTIAMLIASVVLLALFGVLAIWEVFSREVLSKSLGSIAIVTFSSLIIIFVCLQREGHALTQKKMPTWSAGKIILYAVLALIGIPFLIGIFSALFRY